MSRRSSLKFICVFLMVFSVVSAVGAVDAPDAVAEGPFTTATGEYRLPAQIYPDVRSGVVTEVWAKTHYPLDATGDLPVLVFLHGNHSTCGTGSNPRRDTNCQYTNSGTCPNNFVVVPNHEGYDYIAGPLASWGYVVVSINANRGITCALGVSGDTGLNKARGRLVLKHLQRLSAWNLDLADLPGAFDPSLLGRLDFDQVGLMGHSRGGEGVRAAHNLYREPGSEWVDKIPEPVVVRTIFEIGAVDGQTDTVFDAPEVVWNQLLPMCDGDVSSLEGIQPMDRMMNDFAELPTGSKSSYTVWGANHNFFNSEWQEGESRGCLDHDLLPAETTGSAAQRRVGRSAVMALFRGTVGPDADPEFLRNFNPAYRLPGNIIDTTRVDRGYIDSPNARVELPLEDFSAPTGTNRWGFANDQQGISNSHTTVPDHDRSLRAGRIDWDAASPSRFLQINTSEAGSGRDIGLFSTLDFRVSRQTSQPDFLSSTDFSVSLTDAAGTESVRVPISDYTDLTGPVGADLLFGGTRHPILQTVRIPLADFAGADLAAFRGVRFTFDVANPGQTSDDGGEVHLADVRLSRFADETPFASAGEPPLRAGATPARAALAPRRDAQITTVHPIGTSALVGGRAAVEVTVVGAEPFAVTDALPMLRLGTSESRFGRYSEDTHSLTFVFARDEWFDGAAAELRIGGVGVWELEARSSDSSGRE